MKSPYLSLTSSLRKNGFDYSLVKRGKRALIYEQKISPSLSYYEVFRIMISEEKNIFGKAIPATERFPNNEAFGEWAFSYSRLSDAEKRFNELEKVDSNMYLLTKTIN